MRPVYLLLGLSFIALLMAGCSSSEQPVPSAPTPDLETTVEAIVEEKLAAIATPIQNTSNESTSVLSESLGALPAPTSTPTPIPPTPTATAEPVTKAPVVQVQVAKAAPTAAPIAVVVMPTTAPPTPTIGPITMKVNPTPTPTPTLTPIPTPNPQPKRLLQAFQGDASIGISIGSYVHQLSWSLRNEFHEDITILEAYMQNGNGTITSSINADWMNENWGGTTLFAGEQLGITNSFAGLYPTLNEVQSYIWTWVLRTQMQGDIECSFTWTIATSCLHVEVFISFSNPTYTPTPTVTPIPTPVPTSNYVSVEVDQLPQGYTGWANGFVTNNHPTKSITVELERQIKNAEGYIIKRITHANNHNNMCIKPGDTHRFRFSGSADPNGASSNWELQAARYECTENFDVAIDNSLLSTVQIVITKRSSGQFTITIKNDYSKGIQWAGRIVVMDSQGHVVYRKHVGMGCIIPNEQQTKYTGYSRDKDSFTPNYSTSNWDGINLLEPELVETHLRVC